MLRSQFRLLYLWIIIISAACPTPGIAAADKCEPQVAKIVSVQGRIDARRAGEIQWQPAGLNDTYCPGDTIRVRERSRAAIVLFNETVLRLDQNTTVTFPEPEAKEISLLDLLTGAIHFFSRVPRTLKVNTPFVNAAVEGTEFLVKVEKDQATLTVFEGEVVATNEQGRLILRSGESAVAMAGEAPKPRVVARPRDAVQWALYYPPIIDYRPADFRETDWQGMVRRSIEAYRQGDLAGAFGRIREAPEDEITDPRFFTYRAALLLTVGRVDEAATDIDKALNLAPNNSHAFALQTIMAVVQNQKDKALDLARKAVTLDAESPAAKVALSYAQQANFDLSGALASLQEAVHLRADNALAWARLSELWLSVGDLDKALEAAAQAVSLNPNLARTQTVLGFAFLTQIKIGDATEAFEKAIVLDQAAPLPRLGLGLAKIRQGDLAAGRREIEIAVSLDPNNSLIRSYLGKAYYEEKRDKLAASQYAAAKELDPLDPTPWFYDAIRKQTINRPVEALHDLQKSIELNDNRAVYRSRLLLDGDLAARSASLGRIYSDLGFQQLALVEGWKSVNTDPSDYSGHRFLADTYSTLPRHEIARVSELLQSQLLQPINITPLQPQLAQSNLLLLSGAGPSDLAFNEFNPLFTRDRTALQLSAVGGSNSTHGDDLVASGIQGKVSYSVGQFHHETDGFRDNNDQDQDVSNAFIQTSLSPKTSFQAEIRSADKEAGDLPLRFDPNNVFPGRRKEEDIESFRLGTGHVFSTRSQVIASIITQHADMEEIIPFPPLGEIIVQSELDDYAIEVQYQYRGTRWSFISGIGEYDGDSEEQFIFFGSPDPTEEDDIQHTNGYLYSQFNGPRNWNLTIGVSGDSFEGALSDRNKLNPKLGIIWHALPSTTVRAAAFRVFKRTLIANQTVEPTQVAGFNQFFDDRPAAESKRYGIAIDQKLGVRTHWGIELSRRDIEFPFEAPSGIVEEADWEEQLARAYFYWTPLSWLAVTSEYSYEKLQRQGFQGDERFIEATTQRIPFGVSFFHRSGLIARITGTYVDQDGLFVDIASDAQIRGSDNFWVFDASIGYRLPKRRGIITIGARNLFDEDFMFQDTDPGNPLIAPERLIFGRFTLSF